MTDALVVPMAGIIVDLADVPDPVFAQGIVGPGLAIAPEPVESAVAVAPVSGKIVKLHPHAFVIQASEGHGVLTHLGLDTVQLGGEGFELHVEEGDEVQAGQPIVTWSPSAVVAGGRSAVVPVIALQADLDSMTMHAEVGSRAEVGAALYDWN